MLYTGALLRQTPIETKTALITKPFCGTEIDNNKLVMCLCIANGANGAMVVQWLRRHRNDDKFSSNDVFYESLY